MKSLLLIASFLLICSCSEDDTNDTPNTNTAEQVRAANDEEITTFIAANNLEAQKTDSGLYYVIDEEGTGARPTATANVTVGYRGYYTNNVAFDEGTETGFSTNLQNVIPGWTEGIPLFREGGRGMLLIPSHLAYGLSGFRSIPGGAVLIFDINLISVN